MEGMGEGAGDGRTYVRYGPWTFCSNSFNALRAYAMKLTRGGDGGAGGTVVERGGRSGHANKCVTNHAQVGYRPWPFKALEEVEGGEGDRGVQSSSVEGVGDEHC